MKTLFAAIITLTFIYTASAQKRTYTFDYAITMDLEDNFKNIEPNKSLNQKRLVCTLLNSKDRSYFSIVSFNADSTQKHINIIDFEDNQSYLANLKDKDGKLIINEYSKFGSHTYKLRVDTSAFERLKPDSLIDNYLCKQIVYQHNGYTFETWFTSDLRDAPLHSFYAIGGTAVYPPQYRGVPVRYWVKSPTTERAFKLVTTNKVNGKIRIKGDKLVSIEGDLKVLIDKK